MSSANPSIQGVSFSPRAPYRLLTVLLAAAVIVAAGCGGGKGAKSRVYGKVSLNGQPVKGTVFFIGTDGKQKESGIGPGGTYEIFDLPAGEVSILVKGFDKPAGEEAKPKLQEPKEKGKLPGAGSAMEDAGVNPPSKNGKKDTSPLKYTVKGGSKEEHNIELTK
jgi:hypothetical protein